MSGNWERRWNALLDQWVIIAANTTARPWSGLVNDQNVVTPPAHDPSCYLCPEVTRANGVVNPAYSGTRAFDNDYPSLASHAPQPDSSSDTLLRRESASGRCRVLCWSEKHNLTLPDLSDKQMRAVVDLWCEEVNTLSGDPAIKQLLIFENKGVESGASNLHPHGQIYAYPFVTDTGQRMRNSQKNYALKEGSGLLADLLNHPECVGNLVESSEHCSVIVPFAARFSYETWVIPHRQVPMITDLNEEELDDLAGVYQRQAKRYDILFKRPAPNLTMLHNAPCDEHVDNLHWHFHIAMQPPLRDLEKVKFLAGAEAGSNNIVNPLQPETAAEQLRNCIIES